MRRIGAAVIGCLLAAAAAPSVGALSVAEDPPFVGVAFISPEVLTSSDPTAFQGVTPAGQGSREMFDRRVNGYITVNAHLFSASFADGPTVEVQVNPEFNSGQAQVHAIKYATELGRLPAVLLADVQKIVIHDGIQDFGGGPDYVLIHVGKTPEYEGGGFLEEILIHEASHTSLDDDHAAAAGWLDAQEADPAFISEYAQDFPDREDVAESFGAWFALRFRKTRIGPTIAAQIEAAIPNRLDYLDGLGSTPYGDPPFSDVPYSHPFFNEIAWMFETGISTGFNDGTYKPSAEVTRQAMSAFMARLADATLTACSVAPFSDVPTNHPFCPDITWMKTENISTGFNDGTYRPSISVTRQAMSAFLARFALGAAGADALPACTAAPFNDVPTSHPFCKEIKWMADTEISTGFNDGTYRPSNSVTRQAMSAFMYRVSLLP